MGSPRFTLRTGVLAATFLLAPATHMAHPAYAAHPPYAAPAADGGRGVSVIPSTPTAGGEIALKVSGCTGKTAKAVSAAFVADARLIGTDGTLAGETKIRTTAEPGAYDVTITCADVEVRGKVTVAGRGATPHATPVAPVQAGGGGAADRLAARTEQRVDDEARAHPLTQGHPLPQGGYSPAQGHPLAQPRATPPSTSHAVTGLTLAGLAALAVLALRGVLRRRGTRTPGPALGPAPGPGTTPGPGTD
ncbi:hypothetical protein IAG44_25805 [Streptomyces roseirectus]|uniref:Lipoprotein n=1 Tax=Streptomyces roseirectus TaxID=2768066 RepID=A0A7H0II85_9ACTN|nr:hypothetical protein [Streptomyces roseirectus]QNP72501.1 hypothetical protein IAG44_25805 [Streptomyces roseirectus]